MSRYSRGVRFQKEVVQISEESRAEKRVVGPVRSRRDFVAALVRSSTYVAGGAVTADGMLPFVHDSKRQWIGLVVMFVVIVPKVCVVSRCIRPDEPL